MRMYVRCTQVGVCNVCLVSRRARSAGEREAVCAERQAFSRSLRVRGRAQAAVGPFSPAPPGPRTTLGLCRPRTPAPQPRTRQDPYWLACLPVSGAAPPRPSRTCVAASARVEPKGRHLLLSPRSRALALARSRWPGNLRPRPAARSRPRPRLSAHPRLAQDVAFAFHSGGRCPARAAEACCPAESGAARPCVKKKKHEHSYGFHSKPRPAPANVTRPGCTPSSLTCHPRHACYPVRRRAHPGRPR